MTELPNHQFDRLDAMTRGDLAEEIRAALDQAEATLAAASPLPWEKDRYQLAGVLPKMFGEGKCANCSSCGEPIWQGMAYINGRRMWSHEHVEHADWISDGRIAAGTPGDHFLVVNTTDEYGQMDAEDRDLIILAVNLLPGMIEHGRDVLARHRRIGCECGFCEYSSGGCGECGSGWPCHEITGLASVWLRGRDE